jgi:hypothetical protein
MMDPLLRSSHVFSRSSRTGAPSPRRVRMLLAASSARAGLRCAVTIPAQMWATNPRSRSGVRCANVSLLERVRGLQFGKDRVPVKHAACSSRSRISE